MARRSLRNLLAAFTAAEVDDAQKGADVSDNIQLVYLVDDLSVPLSGYYGTGGAEGAVVGQHAIISVGITNARGAMIIGVSVQQTPHFGADGPFHIWSSAAVPTIVGPASPLFGISEGPASSAVRQIGTITTANLGAGAPQCLNVGAGTVARGIFVAQGRFFNIAWGVANAAATLGITWREIGRV